MAFRKKPEPTQSRRRPLVVAVLLVPIIAGIVWAVRNVRPSAAGQDLATPNDTDAATGAPAAAAPGQSSVTGNGNEADRATATS